MNLPNEATSMAISMEVGGSRFTSIQLCGSFHGSYFISVGHGNCHGINLLSWKLVEASIYVDLLPWKLVEVSIK